jgi:hypothetical protein
MQFGLWLEQNESGRPAVFSDLDETLVHNMEIGWLKDHPQNKEFAKMIVPNKKPYPDVRLIHAEDQDMYLFPRPGATNLVKAISKFADFIILSHSRIDYVEKVVEVLGWSKYVKGMHSAKETKPGELAEKYHLAGRKWLLIDNLDVHSVEITNKMRILGIGAEEKDPKAVAKEVIKKAEKHFIDVCDWVPTVHEYDDYELWRVLPKVKEMLGLDWTKGDPYF